MKSIVVLLALALAAPMRGNEVKSDCKPVAAFPVESQPAPRGHGNRDRNRAIAAVALVAVGVTVSIKLGRGNPKSKRVAFNAYAKSEAK